MCKAFLCALTFVVMAAIVHCQSGSPVQGNKVVLPKQYQDAVLLCTTTVKMRSCEWSYYGTKLSGGESYSISVSSDGLNCTLTVKLATAKNFGIYTCSITFDDGSFAPADGYSVLDAKALVDNLGQSVSVTEGTRAQLTCKPIGQPKPTVSWQKIDLDSKVVTQLIKSSNGSSDGSYSFGSVGDIENAILYIDNVQVTDRANYNCTATNEHGSGTNGVLLRVKSKLAPLWPAIGIIIELIVLALVIIIYELYKRKKSAEKSEDEKDQAANSHDGKDKSS